MIIGIEVIEDTIDKRYRYEDILDISEEGIELPDMEIYFKDCARNYETSPEPGFQGRPYVCDKNPLTEPAYMKFLVRGDVIIILFPNKDDYCKMQETLRGFGYEAFDLS